MGSRKKEEKIILYSEPYRIDNTNYFAQMGRIRRKMVIILTFDDKKIAKELKTLQCYMGEYSPISSKPSEMYFLELMISNLLRSFANSYDPDKYGDLPEELKFCRNCGKKISDEMNYCEYCGINLK
jgi:hypothetical protein